MKISLGEIIANRRKYLQLTQEDLAKRMNVSKSAIAKWETDGGIPDRDNLYKLAEIIEIPVSDMHHIITRNGYENVNMTVNITTEVIKLLESYGYKVTRPDEEK